MRQNRKRIFWGIVFLVLAAGLALCVFVPGMTWFAGVSVWKWFVGAVLLYWLVNNAVFGENLREHFDIFLPLGLLFMVFKSDLAGVFGASLSDVSNWAVLGIAVLLTVAVHLLLGGAEKKKRRNAEISNRFSGGVVYFDVTEKNSFSVSNRMGETEVYFQNADGGDPTQPVYLHVENSLGETVIHVPGNWRITSHMTNKLGVVNVRANAGVYTRELIVEGSNRLGETSFES